MTEITKHFIMECAALGELRDQMWNELFDIFPSMLHPYLQHDWVGFLCSFEGFIRWRNLSSWIVPGEIGVNDWLAALQCDLHT